MQSVVQGVSVYRGVAASLNWNYEAQACKCSAQRVTCVGASAPQPANNTVSVYVQEKKKAELQKCYTVGGACFSQALARSPVS